MATGKAADTARGQAVLLALVRQVTALRMLLMRKGILSQEELDYAVQEIEANLAVNLALDPQRVEAADRAFYERELRRVLLTERAKRAMRAKKAKKVKRTRRRPKR